MVDHEFSKNRDYGFLNVIEVRHAFRKEHRWYVFGVREYAKGTHPGTSPSIRKQTLLGLQKFLTTVFSSLLPLCPPTWVNRGLASRSADESCRWEQYFYGRKKKT